MKSITLICLIMMAMSCNQDFKIERLDGTTIRASELDNRIQYLINEAQVTGLAISVFNHNMPIFSQTYGYSNYEDKDSLRADDVIYGASFSKAVFGYLAMLLVEDGLFDLDTPLQYYLDVELPDLEIEKEWRRLDAIGQDQRYQQITPRMCLSHMTGLPNWRWIEDDQKLKYLYDPGKRYNYSGEGIMLLQWVIEHLTQQPIEALFDQYVFSPLEMHNSSYLWREDFNDRICYGHRIGHEPIQRDIELDDASAAGSMETTLEDYTKFISHILQLEDEGSPITATMFRPNIRIISKAQFGPLSHQNTTDHDRIELSYGLGWGLLNSPFGFGAFKEGHDDGFQHYSIIFPEKQTGVVIMTNSNQGESIFKELLEISIRDVYTPWKWENYIPYDQE